MQRTRRVLLFTPGTELRKIEKAASLTVDGVILDLEDAAALSKKAEARETSVRALAECDFGESERIIRINPIGSGLELDDLAAIVAGARLPDAIVLPKVESSDHVVWLSQRLAESESNRSLQTGSVRILALIETALGVVELASIARADKRLDALIFGAEDLCGDIGATRSEGGEEVFYAKSAMVVHAAANRLQAIDTPFVDLNDAERLTNDTRRSQAMGYTGRLAIHPKQIAPIEAVFTPTDDEVAAARRLVAEHQRHQAEGRGVFELDGKMVDMPMVRAAERVLHRAKNAGID